MNANKLRGCLSMQCVSWEDTDYIAQLLETLYELLNGWRR